MESNVKRIWRAVDVALDEKSSLSLFVERKTRGEKKKEGINSRKSRFPLRFRFSFERLQFLSMRIRRCFLQEVEAISVRKCCNLVAANFDVQPFDYGREFAES